MYVHMTRIMAVFRQTSGEVAENLTSCRQQIGSGVCGTLSEPEHI